MMKHGMIGKKLTMIAAASLAAAAAVMPSGALAASSAAQDPTWSVLNLACLILTILITIVMLISGVSGRKIRLILRNMLPAAASAIAFAVTEDFSGEMILADRWIILMLAIAGGAAVIAFISMRKIPDEEEEAVVA